MTEAGILIEAGGFDCLPKAWACQAGYLLELCGSQLQQVAIQLQPCIPS